MKIVSVYEPHGLVRAYCTYQSVQGESGNVSQKHHFNWEVLLMGFHSIQPVEQPLPPVNLKLTSTTQISWFMEFYGRVVLSCILKEQTLILYLWGKEYLTGLMQLENQRRTTVGTSGENEKLNYKLSDSKSLKLSNNTKKTPIYTLGPLFQSRKCPRGYKTWRYLSNLSVLFHRGCNVLIDLA